MRKQLTFSHHSHRAGVAWLSFQPDGSISCGLRDRTYIAPQMRERIGIWNAYNRVGIEYVVPTDPKTLLPVENPHFTYHPPGVFHLKAHDASSTNDEDVFRGIACVDVTLSQQVEMPWLRLVSKPLNELPGAGAPRSDGVANTELVHTAPAAAPFASGTVEIDFIRAEDAREDRASSPWEFVWHGVGLRVRTGITKPQLATLSWFHFY
jgi:hypothetical protein